MSKVIKQCDNDLRNSFVSRVNGDFLIKITKKVMHGYEFKQMVKSNDYFPISYKLMSHKYLYKISVANNVAMIFYYDSLTCDDIKGLYNDKKYEKKLICDVINQLKFSPLIKSYETGSSITYYPIMTALFSLSNYLQYYRLQMYVDNHPGYRNDTISDFRVTAFQQIFSSIQAVLSQIIIGNFSGAYASLRILLEDYFIYLVLHNSKKGIKEYIHFTDAQQEYENSGNFPEEFLKSVPNPNDAIKYVDYGWLRVLDRKSKTKTAYKFYDVVRHCHELDNDTKKDLYDLYLRCSKHSHGEILYFDDPDVYALSLASFLSHILIKIADVFEKDFETDSYWRGIDLVENLIEKENDLIEVFRISKRFN